MNKVIIALAAAAAVFAASTLEASARPLGGGMGGRSIGGGIGGIGGTRSVGSIGMRSSSFVGVNRGFAGVNRGFVGVNRGFVGSGLVRSARMSNFPLHRTHFRNRFFVGGFGYGLGYSSCLRQVWGVYGLTWVNVCAYPSNYYY